MKIDIEKIITIVLQAGKIIKDRSAVEQIEEKGAYDFVTGVDLAVQEHIQRALSKEYPQIQFLGEESDNSKIDLEEYVWILDPVDGTTNLIHDFKASAISLALSYKKEVLIGIIYNPYLEELFVAEKGKGSFLNGQKIQVSDNHTMEESLISIGTSPYYKSMIEKNFELFKKIFCDVQDIRRSGSAAIDLAYVACGRIEAFFERKLKIWDFAAGMLLIREAGGRVLDYAGEELTLNLCSDVLAGNAAIAEKLAVDYIEN